MIAIPGRPIVLEGRYRLPVRGLWRLCRSRNEQVGASAAVLIASGVATSQAIGFAVAVQAMGVLAGSAVVLFAAARHTGLRLAPTRAAA